MKKIENETYSLERALYHISDTKLVNCTFAGQEDGESALKECQDISCIQCNFQLRYPLWHTDRFSLDSSKMSATCRAAMWYCKGAKVIKCHLNGIKCLRESSAILLDHCMVDSEEFGWKCHDLLITHCIINSTYFLFESKNISIEDLNMTGKYSFQYVENMGISHSNLNTKDAFWHTSNVTIKDSVIIGEYLGWYSKNLTFINCTISGTQPLCYCENLKLINCKMENCDLAFEYSSVDATIDSHIDSIKNPKSGIIKVKSVGEIINENSIYHDMAKIIVESTDKE